MTLVRQLQIGVLLLGLSAPMLAQPDASDLARFVGTWQEDRSRRVAPRRTRHPLRFRVDRLGRLQEFSGPEANQSMQLIVFAKPLDFLLGPDPIVWKEIDARTIEQVISDARGTVRTRRLAIDATGNTLREAITDRMSEGPPLTTTTVYRRTEGRNGLVGRWQSMSVETPPADMRVEKSGPGTLRIASNHVLPYELTVDGVPRQVRGPALHVTTRSARVLPDGSLEVREFTDERETSRSVIVVSADGLTMTNTVTLPSAGGAAEDPAVFVLVKQ